MFNQILPGNKILYCIFFFFLAVATLTHRGHYVCVALLIWYLGSLDIFCGQLGPFQQSLYIPISFIHSGTIILAPPFSRVCAEICRTGLIVVFVSFVSFWSRPIDAESLHTCCRADFFVLYWTGENLVIGIVYRHCHLCRGGRGNGRGDILLHDGVYISIVSHTCWSGQVSTNETQRLWYLCVLAILLYNGTTILLGWFW